MYELEIAELVPVSRGKEMSNYGGVLAESSLTLSSKFGIPGSSTLIVQDSSTKAHLVGCRERGRGCKFYKEEKRDGKKIYVKLLCPNWADHMGKNAINFALLSANCTMISKPFKFYSEESYKSNVRKARKLQSEGGGEQVPVNFPQSENISLETEDMDTEEEELPSAVERILSTVPQGMTLNLEKIFKVDKEKLEKKCLEMMIGHNWGLFFHGYQSRSAAIQTLANWQYHIAQLPTSVSNAYITAWNTLATDVLPNNPQTFDVLGYWREKLNPAFGQYYDFTFEYPIWQREEDINGKAFLLRWSDNNDALTLTFWSKKTANKLLCCSCTLEDHKWRVIFEDGKPLLSNFLWTQKLLFPVPNPDILQLYVDYNGKKIDIYDEDYIVESDP